MKFLLKLVVHVGLWIVQCLFAGLVISKLWLWFVVPKFAGAPPLDYLSAVGLLLTIGFVLQHKDANDKDDDEDLLSKAIIETLVVILIYYPLTLLVGYLWHLVML